MTTFHLSILIAALQLADAASTLYFLKHTRLQEANPLLRNLFEKFGPVPVLRQSRSSPGSLPFHRRGG